MNDIYFILLTIFCIYFLFCLTRALIEFDIDNAITIFLLVQIPYHNNSPTKITFYLQSFKSSTSGTSHRSQHKRYHMLTIIDTA